MIEISQTSLSDDLKKTILQGFSRHAVEETGMDGLTDAPIVFQALENDKFIGAVVVMLFWGQLWIKYVYVDESHRQKGIATQLMNVGLDYGRQQKCDFAFVETMNFQAVGFYEKLGFHIEFTRDGYAKGTSFVYLRAPL